MTQEVTNAVVRFFAAVDARDWEAAEQLMTRPFHLDYSSFGAGPGADLDPADVLTSWQAMLPGFDATQHQLGPLAIDMRENKAIVKAYVTATHHIADAEGGEIWTVYGDYDLTLRRDKDGSWRLSANIFNFRLVTGNASLPGLAQRRVGS
ncbi:nuclear transport factor 2 family protein [Lutimaribacter marinistellae]|uniref:Nuclear transport factor 2 family protein n=1 Tax=Lutimaribacter marinistellae TaxID=1820329 RepID=A0ABV7TC93_9RHOB